MNDREMLLKVKEFLTYEQRVEPGMTPKQHRDALATQVGEAWEMLDEYLSAEEGTEPEISVGGDAIEDEFIVYVGGVPTYRLTHELGRKVGRRPAPMVRVLRYLDGAPRDDRDLERRVWEYVRALEAELRTTAR